MAGTDPKGFPTFANSDRADFAVDLTKVAAAASAEAGRSAATPAALPSSGNWKGRTIWDEGSDSLWRWNGSAWGVVASTERPASLTGTVWGSGFSLSAGSTVRRNAIRVFPSIRVGAGGVNTGQLVCTFPAELRPAVEQYVWFKMTSGLGRGVGWAILGADGKLTIAYLTATGATTIAFDTPWDL